MADDLESRFAARAQASKAPPQSAPEDLEKRFAARSQSNKTPPSLGVEKPGTAPQRDQPPPQFSKEEINAGGRKIIDAGLSAIPYAAAGAAGLASGGLGFLPAIGIAAASGAAGGAVEQGLRAAGGVEGPKDAKDFGKRVLMSGVEQGANEVGGRIVGKVLDKTIGKYLNPERLYQSGLKPSGTNQSMASRAVKTGLDEQIPLDKKAASVARQRWTQLNNDIDGIIKNSPADIPAQDYVKNITDKLDASRKRWGKVAGEGQKYIDQIDDFERNFLLEQGNVKPITRQQATMIDTGLVDRSGNKIYRPGFKNITIKPEEMDLADLRANASPLPSSKAQDIKKATYESVRTKNINAYNPGVHPGLQVRMQKDVARALKEELQGIYPELEKLNAREGSLIALEKELERFAKRESNKQMTSYFTPLTIAGELGAGFASGHAEAGAAAAGITAGGALMRKALEDPYIKSKLAIALLKLRSVPGYKTAVKLATGPNAARVTEYGAKSAIGTITPPKQTDTPPQSYQ